MTVDMETEKVEPERLARYVRSLVEQEELASLLMLEEVCAAGRREAEERIQKKAERKVFAARMAG